MYVPRWVPLCLYTSALRRCHNVVFFNGPCLLGGGPPTTYVGKREESLLSQMDCDAHDVVVLTRILQKVPTSLQICQIFSVLFTQHWLTGSDACFKKPSKSRKNEHLLPDIAEFSGGGDGQLKLGDLHRSRRSWMVTCIGAEPKCAYAIGCGG